MALTLHQSLWSGSSPPNIYQNSPNPVHLLTMLTNSSVCKQTVTQFSLSKYIFSNLLIEWSHGSFIPKQNSFEINCVCMHQCLLCMYMSDECLICQRGWGQCLCAHSPGDVLLNAVETSLWVVSTNIGQVESKRPQLIWIFRPWYWNFLWTEEKIINQRPEFFTRVHLN